MYTSRRDPCSPASIWTGSLPDVRSRSISFRTSDLKLLASLLSTRRRPTVTYWLLMLGGSGNVSLSVPITPLSHAPLTHGGRVQPFRPPWKSDGIDKYKPIL